MWIDADHPKKVNIMNIIFPLSYSWWDEESYLFCSLDASQLHMIKAVAQALNIPTLCINDPLASW